MFLQCAYLRVHTVGVCGWLLVLNGHLYSSFMSRATILRDTVLCLSVSDSKINLVHCGCRQRSQGVCARVCMHVFVCIWVCVLTRL